MASIFGHGLVAYTATKVIDQKSNKLLMYLAIGSAMLPDLDVIAFRLGTDYLHPLGHRGFTHSILFATVWGGLISLIFFKDRKYVAFLVLFISTMSHGILDAMTTGGEGVGFFIPFENSRYFFSFREIRVSPIGIRRFFSEWGLKVILSELKFIAIPCFVLLSVNYFGRKRTETKQ
ncbi:metal-dependent hydrolase [Winogradskyella ursingii]|uniref:metal-dependent hydrolase n=1 Tax=Winogradskyella ursingii TaxID=2686079 RepID=UPI0015CBB292|nr:metal-dependent hydrolase [Winogradskyella ursingii]